MTALSQAGCGEGERISRYRVPKPHVLHEANHVERAETDRRGTAPTAAGSAERRPLTYETPEGWSAEQATGITRVAFRVEQGGKKVKITATDLSAGGGELLPNVNRWRGQVGLKESLTPEQLEREIKQIEVGGAAGHYIEIVGPESPQGRQTILGVIVIHGGKAWFFKLMGDAELAEREKTRFEAFVQSVRFLGDHGAKHGG